MNIVCLRRSSDRKQNCLKEHKLGERHTVFCFQTFFLCKKEGVSLHVVHACSVLCKVRRQWLLCPKEHTRITVADINRGWGCLILVWETTLKCRGAWCTWSRACEMTNSIVHFVKQRCQCNLSDTSLCCVLNLKFGVDSDILRVVLYTSVLCEQGFD